MKNNRENRTIQITVSYPNEILSLRRFVLFSREGNDGHWVQNLSSNFVFAGIGSFYNWENCHIKSDDYTETKRVLGYSLFAARQCWSNKCEQNTQADVTSWTRIVHRLYLKCLKKLKDWVLHIKTSNKPHIFICPRRIF